eukprot:GHRQ01020446.1.p1 GENE.GHRQ01020446.1~~GHRQ01020446.1.p1  ORF type:complete len:298 (+),score=51.99 GHRQ01020446.1:130-1023(+)
MACLLPARACPDRSCCCLPFVRVRRCNMQQSSMQFSFQPGFTAVNVGWDDTTGAIGHIVLNRPTKSNAFDSVMWREFPAAVRLLQQRHEIRVLVISAAGKNFCAGLDLAYLTNTFGSKMQQQPGNSSSCPARMHYAFREEILQMQEAFTVLEQCRFPVIAAVQGAAVELEAAIQPLPITPTTDSQATHLLHSGPTPGVNFLLPGHGRASLNMLGSSSSMCQSAAGAATPGSASHAGAGSCIVPCAALRCRCVRGCWRGPHHSGRPALLQPGRVLQCEGGQGGAEQQQQQQLNSRGCN